MAKLRIIHKPSEIFLDPIPKLLAKIVSFWKPFWLNESEHAVWRICIYSLHSQPQSLAISFSLSPHSIVTYFSLYNFLRNNSNLSSGADTRHFKK